MKIPHVSALLAIVAIVAFATGVAFTEDAPAKKPMTVAEVEAKSWELRGKGPEHERLAQLVGTWDVEGKAYTQMMGEIPFRGVVVMKPLWDGRFLETSYEGPGMTPDEKTLGLGVLGFNRMSGKYEGTWLMNMNTHTTFIQGTYDEATKTYAYTGSLAMPDGTTWSLRQTLVVGPQQLVETQWWAPPGGKESKTVAMTYTRRAEKPTTGK